MASNPVSAYTAAIEQEIAERQRLLEAYRLVEKDMSRRGLSLGSAQPAQQLHGFIVQAPSEADAQGKTEPSVNISALVRQVCKTMTNPFTVSEVQAALKSAGYEIERQKISFTLSRLKRAGELQELEPGAGNRPATFQPQSLI